jgi:uncharacterized protein (TIGR00730 family)
MAELSDGFAALPGGVGTADELFEIVTWAQLGLLNTAGYFDALLAWMQRMTDKAFLRTKHCDLLLVADTPDALLLLVRLRSFQPIQPEKKWIDPKDL